MSRETRNAPWSIEKATQVIALSPSSLSVGVGETDTITVTWLGDGTLSATSSDTTVATVSVSGAVITVNGVVNGSVTITASVSAGTNYIAGTAMATATIDVPKEIAYVGSGTALMQERRGLAGAASGNYIMFGGGSYSGGTSSAVDVYVAE